jgi:rhodanese-related sulfurtransferase
MKRVAALLLMLCGATAACADPPVGITPRLPHVDVLHAGRPVRIQREPDNLNQIEPDFALTSRPCPPYCIQPMQLAPGVETLGELELLDYLKRSAGDDKLLVIDSREPAWLARSGIIPGAINLPWDELHSAYAEAEEIAAILSLQFGASRAGPLWNFESAKTLVFYCNGAWCGQSPSNIKQLLAMGYPAHKLKWYRGGMQAWKGLGLTTVPFKQP